MPIGNFEQFSKAVVSISKLESEAALSSIKFNSVLSGLNYALTYGAPTLPESEINSIRNADGFTYFMIGVDTVGSVSRVHGGYPDA